MKYLGNENFTSTPNRENKTKKKLVSSRVVGFKRSQYKMVLITGLNDNGTNLTASGSTQIVDDDLGST
jgi:hypothetical protein